MGRLIFGMLQSLDGYIAGPADGPQAGGVFSLQAAAELPPPGPAASRHFTELILSMEGHLYGTRMYEIMRYWEQDKPDWDKEEHDFAQAWRPKPKWVASRSLKSVGPNATLVPGDLVEFAAKLRSERKGDIGISGAEIANVLSAAGLVDEYQLYFQPRVLGRGKPFFAGPVPPLRLVKHDAIGDDMIQLTYVPA